MKREIARFAAGCVVAIIACLVLGPAILNAEKSKSESNGDPKWKVEKPDLTEDLEEADNSYCLVCHVNLEDEKLVETHLPFGIGCETCHGMSIKHSADEDNLTPPDIMWSRQRMNLRCLTCHAGEKMLKEKKAAKAHKKMLKDMAKPDPDLTKISHCTKCHGKHKLKNRTRIWDKETGEVLEQTGGPNMDRLKTGDDGTGTTSIFAKQNLVAWCIVPFDAKRRGPAERAEMLVRLGLRRVAYDWRQEHIPTFEQEILEYKKHNLEYFAFWSWHPSMEPLIQKYGIKPQIWEVNPSPAGDTQQQRVEAAARQMLPRVELTRKLGVKFGLYNHGGWGGEPKNLVAVTEWLRQNADADHVGIIYNFHHGHGHIADFEESLNAMKPYLFCLNLNGMNPDEQPKIMPIGDGKYEQGMLQIVRKSGYAGPIGILDHRVELDSEESLRQNIDGLRKVLVEIGDEAAVSTYK